MNAQRFAILSGLILIIALMLTSCGPGQFLGPTITPSPTNTFIPTLTATSTSTLTATSTNIPSPTTPPSSTPAVMILATAKTGQWSGDIPSVSFEVTDDGHIRGLKIAIPMSSAACLIEVPDIEILVDGTFTFLDSFGSSKINRLEGKFTSETSMSGIYGGSSIMCKINNLSFFFEDPQAESKFSASWEGS